MNRSYCVVLLSTILASSLPAQSVDTAETSSRYSFHFQQTIVSQYHPGFSASYTGRNSLSSDAEQATSYTATIYAGAKLWDGAEVFFNPEMSAGKGFSRTQGVAGFPNGEIYRVDDPSLKIYAARLFITQTIELDGATESIPDDANQIAEAQSTSRLTLTLGKFSITDYFDNNGYSHDPRRQFLNWSLMDNGAWDYPADTRGYTWGIVAELVKPAWALRCAAVMVASDANGPEVDAYLAKAHAFALEYERAYEVDGRKGITRAFVFENVANAGNYRATLETPADQRDITKSRTYGAIKYGAGISVEQTWSAALGFFLRASWNDGATETWAFTEIDRSVSGGVVLKGIGWHRPLDEVGVAAALNGISNDHEEYLARGGYGFIIGDGALSYAPERIFECYYKASWSSCVSLSADYQFILHPGHNADRGPVHVFGIRFNINL